MTACRIFPALALVGLGAACASTSSSTSSPRPETWRVVIWTETHHRIGALTLQFTGNRVLGTQYDDERWIESGRVVDAAGGGTAARMPAAGDPVERRHGPGARFGVTVLVPCPAATEPCPNECFFFSGDSRGNLAEGEVYLSNCSEPLIPARIGLFEASRR